MYLFDFLLGGEGVWIRASPGAKTVYFSILAVIFSVGGNYEVAKSTSFSQRPIQNGYQLIYCNFYFQQKS